MDEFDFIDQILRPLATHPGAHGLRDDGASLPPPPPGQEWRLTTDTLIAGVHFRETDPLDGVVHRALATNVSDLVAQLSEPRFYSLNLSLPENIDLSLLGQGLATAQDTYGLGLLGGDTTRTPGPLTISVTAFGLGVMGQNPLRSGAKVGQNIGLLCAPHGALGAAKAGLEGHAAFERAYLRPDPCLSVLGELRAAQISSMADVSDGLIQDLGHICSASGVGAELQIGAVPVAIPDAPKLPQITWGDDYALVMTADTLPQIPGLIEIGQTVPGAGVKLLDRQGQEIEVKTPGYVHGAGL